MDISYSRMHTVLEPMNGLNFDITLSIALGLEIYLNPK